MSRGRESDSRADDRGAAHPDMPNRADGSTELDLRETLVVLFYDPAVRNYAIAALSALAMIFLVLFEQASDIGGILVVLLGVAGLLLRWVAIPPVVLLIVAYFMYCPFGFPGDASPDRLEIENGRFRVPDIILTLSLLVYAISHYRVMGFVHQALAYDGAAKRKDEPPTRRPPALIAPAEVGVLLGVAAVFTVVGQLVWYFATSVEIDPADDFPIRWVGEGRTLRRVEEFGVAPTKTTIFLVLLGLLFFGALLARLVFGYWRLRTMQPAEGGMILLDGGWAETKRERSRLEKWRTWGRKRAEARAKAAAEAEDLARAKARAAEIRAERARRAQSQRSTSRGKR